MPKGLHALPDMPRVADEERVAEFLALFPETGPRSFFAGIERVEPGCVVTLTLGGATTRRHWNPARGGRSAPGGDVVEALRAHLDQAVRSRLRGAEGGVAAHLSAGLDSTAVTTTAARLLAPTGGRVLALTAVPGPGWSGRETPGRLSDEGPIAALTAASHPNIDHLRLSASGGLLDRLDEDTDLHDRPLFNLCNQPWWSTVAEAAARKTRVLLTGELGNTTVSWAGTEVFPELMRQGRWGQAWRLARAWVASGAVGPRAAIIMVVAPWVPGVVWRALRHLRSGPGATLRHSALEPVRAASMPSRARRAKVDLHYQPRRDGFESRLWHIGRTDPGVFRKATLAAWGVDVRDPTADRRLVEFCLTLPAESFFLDGRPRELARRVLADRAPAEVLAEPRRGYQAADWAETLTSARHEVRRILSTSDVGRGAEMLDLARLRQLAGHWPQGREWDSPEAALDYRQALPRGLSALVFLRRAAGSVSV
jgi:asparagine synthase (glutamine-hydrolysing)